MKRFALLLCFAGFALPASAEVVVDPGLAEVVTLARLNGVALACSNPEVALRIKNAMIQHAPKSPRYGVSFEQVTSTSFLDQLKLGQGSCPDTPTLAGKVDETVAKLRSAVQSN